MKIYIHVHTNISVGIITLLRNSQMVSSTLYSFKIYSPNTNVTFAGKNIMEDKYYSKRQIHFLSFIDIHKSLDYVRCFFWVLQQACDVRHVVSSTSMNQVIDAMFFTFYLRKHTNKHI
jgi:hypothetical protein